MQEEPQPSSQGALRIVVECKGRREGFDHLRAPLKEVEARDPKGLYKKAREGKIKGFTGIDAPYEAPENPEVHCRTDQLSITQSANKIMEKLDEAGIHLHRTFRPLE